MGILSMSNFPMNFLMMNFLISPISPAALVIAVAIEGTLKEKLFITL